MDRCRGNQGWTTACSGMPESDGKDQEEDSPKQACSLVLVRSPLLTSHRWRKLVSTGCLVCRCHEDFLWCYVCFVLLRFRLYAFVEAAALRSIVLRYAGVPMTTRVSFFYFVFVYLEMSLFPGIFLYHFRFLFVWIVRSTFFPSGWCFFYLVTTGWIFDISFLCENQSINQSIYVQVT